VWPAFASALQTLLANSIFHLAGSFLFQIKKGTEKKRIRRVLFCPLIFNLVVVDALA
jgi:hypothetical protein